MDYDEAIKIAPDNPKLFHSKGLAYQGQSESYKEVKKVYDQELNKLAIEYYNIAL